MRTVSNSSSYPSRTGGVRLVVVHTAETPCEEGRAYNIASYLANPAVRASAHYVVDPGETVAQVPEEGTAWAAPGANSDGIQIEQAAYAKFGSGEEIPEEITAARAAYGTHWPDWDDADAQRMLREQLAPLVAGICRRWGLPAVWLSAADLLAGRAGVTDHNTVNEAYRASDHWDCGPSFPAGLLMELVRAELGETTAPADGEKEAAEMPLYMMGLRNGDVVAVYDGGRTRQIGGGEYKHLSSTVPLVATSGEAEDAILRAGL